MGEPDGFKWPTVSRTKGRVTGSNESKTAEPGTDTKGSQARGEISDFSSEEVQNVFTHSREGSIPTVRGAFGAELITLNNA